ncbi:MAG TPA: SURF1 family cytochrome oxidase biogenesis protein, partial [Gemmatimonadales bacterium]|nr:SURF1 family cytochrome oxidase biogenesis protein [Gemmatimonadales bacterium]
GVEVATPLRIEGSDTALVVVHGFVPSDDAMSVDLAPLDETGPRSVHGIAFSLPTAADSGAPLLRNGARTYGRLDLTSVRAALPYPVYDVAVWQERDSGMTGMPVRLGAPVVSEGPHLSYAIQWFAFAVIFGVGGVVYLLRKRDEGGPNAAP